MKFQTTAIAGESVCQTVHITVTYSDSGGEIIAVYAVNEDISRELDRRIEKPVGKDLRDWLGIRGCKLDSAVGPARIERAADGRAAEEYYRGGKPHRDSGPAYVRCTADGTMIEEYFQNGDRHREDGPAIIRRYANGKTIEEYWRDGKWNREDGPAVIRRAAAGARVERYYRDGRNHCDRSAARSWFETG